MSPVRFYDPVSGEAAWPEAHAELLGHLHRKLLAGRNLDEILEFVFDETRPVMPCDRIGVAFLEDGGERVVSYWIKADYEPTLLGKGYAGDMKGSTLATVLERGGPRVIPDLQLYLEANPDSHATRLLVKEGVRASMTCPLKVEGRNVGFLFRSSRTANAYTDEHVRFHQAMSELLGQAVEKAWRIEQLDNANNAYLEMLGFVSHELKNPLASMITQASVLRDGLYGELTPRQKEVVEKVMGRAQFLIGLVKDYLDLARLEGRESAPSFSARPFVAEVLNPALEMLRPQLDAERIRLELDLPDPDPVVELDPTMLLIVMNNLLGNAVKYGVAEGRVRVTVRTVGDSLEVRVWNQGPGFAAAERGRLFRKFSRLSAPELLKRKGTGVGLYTTWRMVKLHNGTIDASSEEGQWAEFFFTIPLRQPTAARMEPNG